MRKYFVSPGTNWDSTDWSLWPGGPNGYSPPGPDETAVFDSNSPSCTLDSTVNCAEWLMQDSYSNTILQQSLQIDISENADFFGGHFYGQGADINIGGNLTISDCNVWSTDKTLSVEGDLFYQEDPGDDEFLFVEEFILTADDASNKYITLSFPPADSSQVTLNILNGVPQRIGVDYNMSFMTLTWSGYTLEDDLAEDDVLRVMYSAEHTGFNHHFGDTVLKSNDNTCRGGGIELWDLDVFQDNSGYWSVETHTIVENDMYIEGYLKAGGDATVHIRGDLSCAPDFGIQGEGNRVFFVMDGTGEQKITVEEGSLLPSFGVNRSAPGIVTAWGISPLSIDGDFELIDGTFNTNRLDVNVGVV